MQKIITEKERSTKKTIRRIYLGSEDLRPKSDLLSKPICINEQAFEQHINWEEDTEGNTM